MRIFFAFLIMTFALYAKTWAQDICNDPAYEKGGFSLNSNDYCHNESVTITNTSGVENAKYYFNYQGQSYAEIQAMGLESSNFTFATLKQSDVYTVIQVGKKNGKETVTCINDVKVRVSNQPVFSYTYCFLPTSDLTISIPKHPLNDHTSYTISLSNNPNIPSVTTLPYTRSFPVRNPVNLTITGVGGNKTCSTPTPPVNLNYSPAAGNNLANYPQIKELNITDNDQIKINFTGQYGEKYDLFRYPSTSPFTSAVEVETNLDPGVHFNKVNNSKNVSYCYFVKAKTNSRGCFLPTSPFRSAEICTVPLQATATDINQNQLIWTRHKFPDFPANTSGTDHDIPKHDIVKIIDGEFSLDSPILTSQNPYRDQNLECKYRYCYRIKATVSGFVNTANYSGTSYSNEICIDHKEGPLTPPTNVLVSTSEDLQNAVYFENIISNNPIDKWVLLKNNGNDFTIIKEAIPTALEIADDQFPVTESVTYKLKYQDICGNESETSKPVSSVFLSQDGNNRLAWTSSNPFSESNIKHYEIIYFNDDSQQEVAIKTENANTPYHSIDSSPFTSTGTFRIRTLSADGKESFSNSLSLPIKGALYLPTVFTPNNHGPVENEIFAPKGSITSIKDFIMEVYSINGGKIAKITDPTLGWDGKTSDGTPVDSGVYFYTLNAVMLNGQVIRKNGSFAIVK